MLVPEGGVGDPRRAAARSRRTSASSRSTPACCSTRRSRRGARSRSASACRSRSRRRSAAAVDRARALLRRAEGRRAASARSPAPTPGSPACAASRGRRAPTPSSSRSTTSAADREVQPARGVDRAGPLGAHPRARPALPPAARPGLRLDRLRAVHAAGRRPRGPLGGHRRRPSAGCTSERCEPHGPARHPLRPRRRHPHRPDRHRRRLAHDAAAHPRSPAIPPVVAIGTDLAYGAVTKTVGGWRHWRKGTVDLGVSTWLAVGCVPGRARRRLAARPPARRLRRELRADAARRRSPSR